MDRTLFYKSFLKRMVTGDKKQIIYSSVNRERSWSKGSETTQMVSKLGLTVLYSQQLEHLKKAITQESAEALNFGQPERNSVSSRQPLTSIKRLTRSLESFIWKFLYIHPIVRTSHQEITIYSYIWRMVLKRNLYNLITPISRPYGKGKWQKVIE